jgi:hypothetical protein
VSDVFVVRAPVAPLNADPRAGSEQLSQALAGHVVERVEDRQPWWRVRTRDGYEGWMHRGYLIELGAGEYARRYEGARVSLGCVVRDPRGARRALPLGALVQRELGVECGDAVEPEAMPARFPRAPAAAAATARERFEGTSYEWGGITPWGADCSGLVQSVFGLHGIALPRDARDQAERGTPVADGRGLAALDAGDLAFFSDRDDGGITHVAVVLGAMTLVHLAIGRGGYAIERLDTPDEYARLLMARYRRARRVE